MGDHNESERNKNESEYKEPVYFIPGTDQGFINKCYHDRFIDLEKEILALTKRIKALEGVLMQRFAPDTAGHPNDGGWFE